MTPLDMLLAALLLGSSPFLPLTPPDAASFVAAAARAPADRPQAMARLHTEGTLPHQGIHDQSAAAERDLPHMRDLALAWRFAGDRAALASLATYLDAWLATYRPSFNPIDETGFDALIDAYALAGADLPPATRAATQRFLRALATGYLDAMDAHRDAPGGIWTNNWQSHRVKLATMAAAALGDAALLDRARGAFRRQLDANIRPDGETIDFGERDALHYVTYDLEPLTRAAIAARVRGQDWLDFAGKDGQKLRAAIDWLVPYADGRVAHQEFVHTRVRFDLTRRQAGLPGFDGAWQPRGAAALFWGASLLDPAYLPLARRLSPTPPRWVWAEGGFAPGR